MYKLLGADGKEYGPVSAEQMRQWIAEGRANAQSKVQAEGQTEWKLLSQFPEFVAATATVPPMPVIPARIGALPAGPRTNSMATAGFVMGLLSVLCPCCYGAPFNILGIIFSAIALSQINSDPLNQQGRGLAIAGIVLSVLGIAMGVILAILGLAFNSSESFRHLRRL